MTRDDIETRIVEAAGPRHWEIRDIGDIKDRIIEAAEIDRRLPRGRVGPADDAGFWPATVYTKAEIWEHDLRLANDHIARADQNAERNKVHMRPTAREVSRCDEVMAVWINRWVMRDKDRRALRAWAAHMAGGKLFKVWCERIEHIAERTGERRVRAAVEQIAVKLQVDTITTWNKALKTVSPEVPIGANAVSTLARSVHEGITAYREPDAVASDRPEIRDFSWAEKRFLAWVRLEERRLAEARQAEQSLPA